ncbi:hypothetical protein JCM8097_006468 [Rhodosporidiobolus ruineniae]
MAPVIITLVRHGESVDNLTALWAGHRDAQLSNHGYNQATRLGQAFKDVPITAIYASDLKRANTTAREVWKANTTEPRPPFTTSPLLREQFFGEAEGAPWDAGKYSSAHLPWEDHRAFRLAPNAESLNDVARRADLVLRHFVIPHVLHTASLPRDEATPPKQHHILLVAHGIWLSEMLFAIKRAGEPGIRFVKQGGYQNTAWTRVEVELDDLPIAAQHELGAEEKGAAGDRQPGPDEEITSPAAPSEAAPNPPASALTTPARTAASTPAPGAAGGTTLSASSSAESLSHLLGGGSTGRPPLPEQFHALLPTLPAVPSPRDPALPPAWPHADDHAEVTTPKLRHRVVAFNQAEHLVGLKRTGAGVGSAGWDEKQRGLKEFFGGGGEAVKKEGEGKKE